MPRCPDCNKFCSLDTDTDPEVESIDVSDDGVVEIEARIVNCCADCGTELTEASLTPTADCTKEYYQHLKECGLDPESDKFDYHKLASTHALEVEEGDASRDQEGGSRYKKSYYSVTVGFTIKCSCGKWTHEGEATDKVQAAGMESLV